MIKCNIRHFNDRYAKNMDISATNEKRVETQQALQQSEQELNDVRSNKDSHASSLPVSEHFQTNQTCRQNGNEHLHSAKFEDFRYGNDQSNKDTCKMKKSGGCKRRIFELLHTINRNRKRYFKPVPNIRSIHQVIPTENGHHNQNQIHNMYMHYVSIYKNHAVCPGLANHHLRHKMLHENKPN